MPCIFLRWVFRSSTNFKSGQWVHCIRLWALILCAMSSSFVAKSSVHGRIPHLNVSDRDGRLVNGLRFFEDFFVLEMGKETTRHCATRYIGVRKLLKRLSLFWWFQCGLHVTYCVGSFNSIHWVDTYISEWKKFLSMVTNISVSLTYVRHLLYHHHRHPRTLVRISTTTEYCRSVRKHRFPLLAPMLLWWIDFDWFVHKWFRFVCRTHGIEATFASTLHINIHHRVLAVYKKIENEKSVQTIIPTTDNYVRRNKIENICTTMTIYDTVCLLGRLF